MTAADAVGYRAQGAMVAGNRRGPVRQAVGSAGQRPEAGVGRRLSELSREMQADLTDEALLRHIVTAAVAEVPGTQHAAITLVTGGEFSTPSASGDLARRVDQLQYEASEGPCLDAARRHETVRCDDMRAEARWPRFAGKAAEAGVLSMLSFQLFVEDETFGALNLYSGQAGAFSPESESTGMLLASHAALAITAARTQAGLLIAIDSRDLIGQAKGILIERYKISGVEAFGLLVASSQAVNRKLRDVADHLVSTGELLTPVKQASRP
ncbi:MAG: GAF and ANTAR domain-containing protein [Actinomycetota bacterium]|nr:GAF and ANTAR domain-containing protein [Actinomycetota bacterium]